MRSHVLAAGTSLVLILSGHLVAQSIQERPTDHDHPPIGLLGARQLVVKPFTTLPKGVLFLRLENFSTTKAAQDAATLASAVVEWAGKIWLFTLGPKGIRSSAGTFVAEIGPVPDVPPNKLCAGRERSRFRPRDENPGSAASPYAPRTGDLLPSYRRTVPRNSERSDTGASGRRNGRSCKYADATQHHGFIEARCFLCSCSRCHETAGYPLGLATKRRM